MDQVLAQLSRAIGECFEAGLRLPLVVVAVSANGALVAIRYDGRPDALEATPMATYPPGGTPMAMPVNLLVTDPTGRARRFVFERGRARTRCEDAATLGEAN